MNLTDIKNTIANTLEINHLLNEANRVKLIARDGLGPAAEKAETIYDNRITSPFTIEVLTEMQRQSRYIDPKHIMKQIAVACTVVAREAGALEDMLSRDGRGIIMREALNIQDANVIEFIAITDYFILMSRTFLVMVAEFEIARQRSESPDKSSLNYYRTNFNQQTMASYAGVITYLCNHEREPVIEKLKDMPDIKIDQTVLDTIKATEGNRKIDPAGLNLLNIINPTAWAYAGQKIWSEIKLKRLELNNEELDYLELRYQELIMEREGKSNPQMEEKIQRYMDRIQITRDKIARLKKTMG